MKKQKVICVTGAHSGCGKTFVAERIIREIPLRWGAVKYTRTNLYASLTDDPASINTPGKDTARLSAAGAAPVVWIQSPPGELEDLLGMALTKLSHCEAVLIEGNSPADFVSPDLIVFVFGDTPSEVKPSARSIIERADIVVAPEPMASRGKARIYNKRAPGGFHALLHDIIQSLS